MDFELRQLRCVVALAEHKNFGRAARAVHLSQPALSRNVQELEASLGQRLFQRGANGTRLTDEGAIFLEQAKKLLDAANLMSQEVKLLRGSSRPVEELRMGIGMYPGDLLLAKATARFLRQRHDVRIRITTDVYSNIVAPLQRGEIEFAAMEVSGLESDRTLKFKKLAAHAAYILLRKGHPLLTGGKKPSLPDVQNYPWIMPASVTADRFRKLLSFQKPERGSPRAVPEVYVNSVPVMKKIVEQSDGWAFVTLPTVADELRRGSVAVLPTPPRFYDSNFAITWLAERPLSATGKEFVDILVKVDAEVAAESMQLQRDYCRS